VINVQRSCELADGREARVNLIVLDADKAAQGYTGALRELGLRQQPILPQPRQVSAYEEVAAVWGAILNGCGEELGERIVRFDLTEENVRRELGATGGSVVDRAFRTIVKNRVNRGGILAPGASLLKNGEKGKGLLSRWYPDTLRKRILDIAGIRDRITFFEADGIEVMRQNAQREGVVFFIDPPYTVAAKRLYNCWEMDHEELFSVTESMLSGL
jgi:DNA adenine methylase